jgi:hypothetical protein
MISKVTNQLIHQIVAGTVHNHINGFLIECQNHFYGENMAQSCYFLES